MRCADAERDSVLVTGHAEGRCRMQGGLSPGAPKGNRNAIKHGLYTAEALARRREVAVLIRANK
jgi:hypothetical protein